MKKAILFLIISVSAAYAYAQDTDFDSFKRIESDKVLNLSAGQIAKIKKLNKDVGPKFRAIGQSNLSGYEKGQRKKALAIEHKAAIKKVLTSAQIEAWENRYGSMDEDNGLRNIIKDDYDTRLERLEKKYEKDKKYIEKSSLPKDEKKSKLKTLKADYKTEKERLKNERDNATKSGVLSK